MKLAPLRFFYFASFVKNNALDILNNKKKKIDSLDDKNLNLSELRKFYIDNLHNNDHIENEILNQEKFVREYPINRIKDLTLEEYCLGLENFKNSFCY